MNNKIHIIFCRGMQASGKTTFAEKFLTENQNYKRVGRDFLRHMLSNYTFDDKNEQMVTSLEMAVTEEILSRGFNLIVDKMNLNKKRIDLSGNYS